jgi:hypothetical protein
MEAIVPVHDHVRGLYTEPFSDGSAGGAAGTSGAGSARAAEAGLSKH